MFSMCTIAAALLAIFHPGAYFKEPQKSMRVDEKGNYRREGEEMSYICRDCRRAIRS